jgi:hypothetical protein
VLTGVRAVERPLRSRDRHAPSCQLSRERQRGITVGLLAPKLHEPAPVGESVRLEPARMRPKFAHLDTEGVSDLRGCRRPYFAPHGARRLPLATGPVDGFQH